MAHILKTETNYEVIMLISLSYFRRSGFDREAIIFQSNSLISRSYEFVFAIQIE